jgi:hypothetical protein
VNGLWVDGGIVVAVAGLLAKEAVSLIKRGRNGKGNGKVIETLLNDIKGVGTTTLNRVGRIEEIQGKMSTAIEVLSTKVCGFDDRFDGIKDRVDNLDGRVFDLQKRR